MGRWPNLFIVGAPRAATTSLTEYLEGHPDVRTRGSKPSMDPKARELLRVYP